MRFIVVALFTYGTAFAREPGCLGPEVGEAVSDLVKANGIPVPEGFVLGGITIAARSIHVALHAISGDRVMVMLEARGPGRCGKYFCWTVEPEGALDPDPIGTAIDGLFHQDPLSRCDDPVGVIGTTGGRGTALVPRPVALGLAAFELALLVMATVVALLRTACRKSSLLGEGA